MTMTSIENNHLKAFVDTNVIIDAFTQRDYSYGGSISFLRQIIKGSVTGYICDKQITDLYYVLKKYVNDESVRRKMITSITNTFEILPLLKSDVLACLNTDMNDLEDAILDEVAKVNVIPYFVTNNVKDFKNSKVPAITPEQFLTMFQLN